MFDHWVERLFRPLVIAGMMTCVVISIVEVVELIVPAWDERYLVLLAFGITLEGIYSERLIKRRRIRGLDRLKFRLIEVVVILLALKFVGYLPLGLNRLLADMALWPWDISTFFSGDYLLEALLLLAVWQMALFIVQDLYIIETGAEPATPKSGGDPISRYLRLTRSRPFIDRHAALGRIVESFFWGGAVLLACSGLARLGLAQVFDFHRPPLVGIMVNALIYFLLGLTLISQAHFSIMRTDWQLQRIEVSPSLTPRWALLSLGFISLVVILSFFLPTGYSAGLPQFILTVVQWGLYLITYVFFLLISPLLFFLACLVDLLFGDMRPDLSPVPPKLQPVPPAPPGSGFSLWEAVRMVLFWAILLVVVGYSFYVFLRDRRQWLSGLYRFDFLKNWIEWWVRFWRKAKEAAGRAGGALSRHLGGIAFLGKSVELPWRFLSLSSLGPQELVRYFYLSILRRATRAGHPRWPHQTPYEYAPHLRDRWPEAEPEWAHLTQAFVEARYSQRDISPEEARALKEIWQKVRAALRKREASESR